MGDEIIIEMARFIHKDDFVDLEYRAWSRIYEYPAILNYLIEYYEGENITIHNSCCGGHDIDHIRFMKQLESNINWNILNSDVNEYSLYSYLQSNLKSPMIIYDVLDPISLKDKQFDIILNISTLEEFDPTKYDSYVEISLSQLKVGGRLLITCDYPQVQIPRLYETINGYNSLLNYKSSYNSESLLTQLSNSNLLCYNNTKGNNTPDPFQGHLESQKQSRIVMLILKKGD